MRILYSHYLTDQDHPAARMVQNIARELRLLGDIVFVHASDRSETRPTNSTANTNSRGAESASPSLVTRAKRSLWFAKRLAANHKRLAWDRKVIREFRPDVVLARQDAYCWSVVKAAKELGVPCVTYADAPVAYESRQFNGSQRWHPPGFVEYIERWGMQQSEATITVSNPAAKIIQRYGIDQQVHVNPNGIDPTEFSELSEAARRERRQALGLGDNVVIGFQGTFKSFHGIDRLREMILWSGDRDDVAWLLVGDGPERRALEDAVTGRANVISLGRRRPEEMAELLALMDIAVAPHSQQDGEFYFCPLKILEYAASGCATIASDQGDIPLMLADGAAGEIVQDDELLSWTNALEMLIDNEDYRTAFGELARYHIEDEYTWKQTASRVKQVLDGLDIATQPRPSDEKPLESPKANSEPAGDSAAHSAIQSQGQNELATAE